MALSRLTLMSYKLTKQYYCWHSAQQKNEGVAYCAQAVGCLKVPSHQQCSTTTGANYIRRINLGKQGVVGYMSNGIQCSASNKHVTRLVLTSRKDHIKTAAEV